MADNTVGFEAITIGLAAPEEIRNWSYGEVKKPETINYRTFKPERDGLFCERIFGPSRDWECHCGKYKKVKFKGIICDRCGVEVTRRKVRRERMGHIELAAPVCHSWYLKGVPSPICLLLDMSRRVLEEVIYFASYLVTAVDAEKLELYRDAILAAAEAEKQSIRLSTEEQTEQLRIRYEEGLRQQQEAAEAAAALDEAPEEIAAREFAADLGIGEAPAPAEPALDIMDEQELSRRILQRVQTGQQKMADLDAAAQLLFELTPKQLISEMQQRQLRELIDVCEQRIGESFAGIITAGLGAEAVRSLLEEIDLEELTHELREEIDERTGARRARAIKRLKIVEAFRNSKNRPEWMVLSVVPVLPPELRPMVQLDGGRFATSDLNDLYRRVINRNNRLRRIMEINAPESIINHERRLLQEAVDALIDNSRRSRPVTGSNRRPLKSLSDMLKGKEGRFRKNLLGKRVDYSGRSVIVVGPELKLHQCGLPREMALELFKPFVMNRLVERGHTTNIKTAKRMVDRVRPEVWDALEEVIEDHPVLLNRAPTLHRLGIQAFEPVLIDGKSIQLHPLTCSAFNADFDGDQMAVHVPLSSHAQAEARLLMLASRNLFKPADGAPIAAPLYDVVLGCYYMTQVNEGARGTGKLFQSAEAVITAYEHGTVDLHARIKARVPQIVVEARDSEGHELELEHQVLVELRRALAIHVGDEHPPQRREVLLAVTDEMMAEPERYRGGSAARMHIDKNVRIKADAETAAVRACEEGQLPVNASIRLALTRDLLETTVGRVIFNSHLPLDMPYINQDVVKAELSQITAECFRIYGQERTAQLLDQLKEMGFRYATRSGLSICMADTEVRTQREQIIAETERAVERTNELAADGAIADDEREQRVLRLWTGARDRIVDDIFRNIDSFNSIWMMTSSGARASRSHISQICGMRGLMADPFGRLIEDLPVRSNFHEGLTVLEYFVSTHGARKGLADTALRTADAGYLTRRLVDVAQDVIIRGTDCGTSEGIEVSAMYEHELHCPHCGQEDLYRDPECHYCSEPLPESISSSTLETLPERIIGRTAAENIIDLETGEVIVPAGAEITERLSELIEQAGIRVVTIRSALTCELRSGVCAKCYGRDLARRKLVETGTAIGIIAAQSIGEPGTQLTMRTFHTGGVAGEYITGVADVKKRKQQALRSLSEDIDTGRVSLRTVAAGGRAQRKAIKDMLKVLESSVHGLLRVVELFEARTPKGQAITAQVDGVVAEIEDRGLRTVIIHSDQPLDDLRSIRGERLAADVVGSDGEVLARKGQKLLKKVRLRLRKAGVTHVKIATSHLVPYRGELFVREGTEVRAGDRLTTGPVDPESILRMKGIRGVQSYLLRGIQEVYRGQGVSINDKHVEVMIRQMLRKRKILDHGDTKFLPGEIVDRFEFDDENDRVRKLGAEPATAEPVLLGITQASLATESFLSAASFQRTTRVLTDAACEYKRDPLLGLKENVIIGRLIPAGSGMPNHRDVEVGFSEDARERIEAQPIVVERKDAIQQLMEDIEAAKQQSIEIGLAEALGPGPDVLDESEVDEYDGGLHEEEGDEFGD